MDETKPVAGADDSKASSGYGGGYGKRPMWQWIILYLIVGGIIYYAVYYFFLMPKAGTSTGLYGTPSSTSIYGQ